MMTRVWVVVILGVVLRFILASASFHPDIRHFDLAGRIINEGNIFNFYDYLPNLSPQEAALRGYPADISDYPFNYPPAIYFFHSLFTSVFNNFFSQSFLNQFLFDLPKVLGSFELNLHLLLLKLPYLVFDLLTAFFLMKLFESSKDKFLALVLWVFNPINLYATYMMGQFDVIPTFFVVLALTLAVKNNLLWSSLALGIGAAFKIYPLFFLVPLVVLTKGWWNRGKIILFGVVPYSLSALPFLSSPGYQASALVANQTLKSFYAQIFISGGESVILFLVALTFFYLLFIHSRSEGKFLWQRFFIILLLFFIFTHYHPQWFLWITPFFILGLINTNFKHLLPVSLSLISFLGLLFFFDPSLTVGLLSPIWPNLYFLPSIWQLLNLNVDYTLLRSLLQTIFVGAALYFIYCYFPKKIDS